MSTSKLHAELNGLFDEVSTSGGRTDFPRHGLAAEVDREMAAGDQAATAKYLIITGTIAAINSRARRGIELLTQASDLVDQIADDDPNRPTDRHVWRMLNSYGTCLDDARGELPHAVEVHERALALANQIGDSHLRGISQCNMGWVLTRLGRFTEAIFQLEQVAGAEFGNSTNYAYARDTNAMILEMHGDAQRAYIYRKIAYEATPPDRPRQRLLAGSDLVRSAVEVGEHDVADSIVESVRAAHKEFPDSIECSCRVQLMELELARHAGDIDGALSIARDLMQTHPDNERVRDEEWAARLMMASLHRDDGRLDEGLAVLEVGPDEEVGLMYRVRRLDELTAIHRARGDWGAALASQREAANLRRDQQIDVGKFLRLDIAQRDDIADRNLELTVAYDDLVALHTRKRDLLDIVAHELRGPVGALRLALELSRDSASAIESTLATCTTVVQRMQRIVRTLEIDQGLHDGALALSIRQTDLRPLLQRVLAELTPRATMKDIRVEVDADADIRVLADPARLEQAIANLFDNAVKFCDRGSTIHLTSRSHQGRARVVVTDDGPGFTSADLDRVFAKRSKLSARPTGGESSSGLGLFISRELLVRMGGSLELESPAGAGAQFACELQAVT